MENKEERGEQFIRQWKIYRSLENLNHGMTAAELAGILGYSKRTIYRDLEVLSSVGLPLKQEKSGGTTRWLVDPTFRKYSVPFSLTELMALYFSKGLLTPLQGTPLKDGIDSALAKIDKVLPCNMRKFIYFTEQTFIPKANALKDYHSCVQTIDQIGQAAREKKKCRITYMAYGRDKADKHLFHPYAVTYYNGVLYCIGYSELRSAIRTLSMDRIKTVEILKDKFQLIKNKNNEEFDVQEFLQESFGISHEGKLEDVVLRFSKDMEQWITERTWHPTQQITKLPNGEIEMKMTVAGMSDLCCWLLPMGDGVKVIQPKKLADDLVDTCKKILGNY